VIAYVHCPNNFSYVQGFLVMKIVFIRIMVILSFLFTSSFVIAEENSSPTLVEVSEKKEEKAKIIEQLSEEATKGPYDEFNRMTPQSSLLNLAQSLKQKDLDRAINYLDIRNLPFTTEEYDSPQLARKLGIVGKQAMNIDVTAMSNESGGHSDDGLPSYRDRITTMKTQNGSVDILMQRVPRGDGVFIWKIANVTVAQIPTLYDEFGYGEIGDTLSEIFPDYVFLGMEIWQLVMLVGIFLIAFIISYAITFPIIKILQIKNILAEHRIQKFLVGPIRFLIAVLILRALFDTIAPSLVARALFEAQTLLIISVAWIAIGLIGFIVSRLADRMKRNGQTDAVVLLKPAATSLKLIIILIALLTWFDNLGYELTALIAGLGVGGVAVALASQKSLENLIGSITIYAAQPVKVGDLCQFGTTVGKVEEIGLRSTQLRTLSRTVVHIPNALFSNNSIENLTQRDKIQYRCRLKLSYNVTPTQIRAVLARIRDLITQDEHIDSGDSRVRFVEFGEYAQELELYIFITTTNFTQYLEYREDINLAIVDIIDQEGVKLIVPVNTVQLERTLDIQTV
jgi:MscS family membrane protein